MDMFTIAFQRDRVESQLDPLLTVLPKSTSHFSFWKKKCFKIAVHLGGQLRVR